jgi:hypothetical protein
MTYISTETSFDVLFDFAGESRPVGFIRTNAAEASYSYTDTLFHSSAMIILQSCSLSFLKEAISAYYSGRDTIGAIEDKWL